MVASDYIVDIQGLHIVFGRHQVLRDVDLQIRQGETVAIIGESGCGKTVLLKTMIGLIRPTHGESHFDGQNLADLNDRQLTEQRMRFGYVFQNAALFDSMTVAQNVAFPLRQHKKHTESDIDQIVHQRITEVGLTDNVLTKKPAELSGGMRKRVGLARALAMNPEILLYDEPTTGLDPIVSDVINELIMRTRERHKVTSVVVTHDMKTARKVADRIVMIYPLTQLTAEERQIIFEGTPDQIDAASDRRVRQFVRGEAGERLTTIEAEGKTNADPGS